MESLPRVIFPLLLILVFLASTIAIALNEDRVSLVINGWIEGKDKIMVKLNIHLPEGVNGKCYVMVRRFSTPYNPTTSGFSEKVYAGKHDPGDVVRVEKILNAYVAKWIIDESGDLRIGYYEPQEFLIMIICKEGHRTTFKASRIVEVYPDKPVYTEEISFTAGDYSPSPPLDAQGNLSEPGVSTATQECAITVTDHVPGSYRRGYCYVWVRGPYLYSMAGVYTSFRMVMSDKRSAMYIEAFSDFDAGPPVKPESEVEWMSAGGKLTPTIVSDGTIHLEGPYRDRVWFHVKYVYEWSSDCDPFAGFCYSYWLLTPVSINSIDRSEVLSQEYDFSEIPNEKQYYPPPTYPPDPDRCGTVLAGEQVIVSFYSEEEPPYESNVPISSISISFGLPGVWSASLGVEVYKAGRHDSEYTVPYVTIINNRDEAVYWWFQNYDPMTYTVRLCCGDYSRPTFSP